MGRCSSSSARTPSSTGDVLMIPAASLSTSHYTSPETRLSPAYQTPKDSARRQLNPFDLYSDRGEIPSTSKKRSFSSGKLQRAQNLVFSPDSVPDFPATMTASHDKAMAAPARAKSPFAVKRQLFTNETPTRSNRSTTKSTSQRLPPRGRPTPNRLLQKMSPIAKERLVAEQTKTRAGIAAAARRGVRNFFENIEQEQISLDEISEVIKELYPGLDCHALALLAYESLQSSNRDDGLVDIAEFQQFIHFLAFFNNVWKDVVYWDHRFGLSVRKKDFVSVSQKLGLFDNPSATFSELDTEGRGRILFSPFCTLCASKRIQTNNEKAGDKRWDVSQNENAAKEVATPSTVIEEVSEVNLAPIQEILYMFDSNFVPTRETVCDLFRRIDVLGNGKIKFSDIEKGFHLTHAHSASKPLALGVYAASDWGEKKVFDHDSFYLFILFLVYFNNLWDYFRFSGKKHLYVSKRRFIRAAPKLGLFHQPEDDFDLMDKLDQGFISFQDLCIVCARRRAKQK
ncbi:hypothetical protein FisN_17Lh140 [Fistulifera solaris]|uniref:Calmodulin n=1 Tax=Fistulifera solaris TaxID=1519565 RepID=A0A1Z5K8U5_FISSO|nr:hypothetical protein FisN_17Lh140 [Fistulifera solaris]|eukprot:GAX22647.1 hypothetical protein FisN_17Lh140 [Fistulifera solaris]